MENGTVWSNSSESSDDSSSPALAHHAQRLAASNMLQTTLTTQLSFTPHKSSASTPSLSSNQEDETEAGEVFSQADAVPNGHLQTSCSHSLTGESSPDCTVTDRASVQSADLSETSADLSCSCPDVSSAPPLMERPDLSESGVPQVCVSAEEGKDDAPEDSSVRAPQTEAEAEDSTTEAGEGHQGGASEPHQSIQESKQAEDAPTVSSRFHFGVLVKSNVWIVMLKHLRLFSPQVPFPTSSSFTLEVETALESFDFLNCSDLDEEEEDEQQQEDEGEKEKEDDGQREENKNIMEEEKVEEEEKDVEKFYSGGRSVSWFFCQNLDELYTVLISYKQMSISSTHDS